MAVDHVGERVCPECGGEVADLDWVPFCSEGCWSSFDHSVVQPGPPVSPEHPPGPTG
jgi:hypothetical protein